jgi:hypothetical protein
MIGDRLETGAIYRRHSPEDGMRLCCGSGTFLEPSKANARWILGSAFTYRFLHYSALVLRHFDGTGSVKRPTGAGRQGVDCLFYEILKKNLLTCCGEPD